MHKEKVTYTETHTHTFEIWKAEGVLWGGSQKRQDAGHGNVIEALSLLICVDVTCIGKEAGLQSLSLCYF